MAMRIRGLRTVHHGWRLTILVLLLIGSSAPSLGDGFDPTAAAAERSLAEHAQVNIVRARASKNAAGASLAHDGKSATGWRVAATDTGWAGRRHQEQTWIAFDLGQRQRIVGISWYFGRAGAGTFLVHCSVDGKKWKTVAEVKDHAVGRWRRRDVGCDARHVRFVIGDARGGAWEVSEARVFGRATLPAMSGGCQRIAVPAYFDPQEYWDKMNTAVPSTGLIILNPNSGPDRFNFQQTWLNRTRAAQAVGIKVVGYVLTHLATRPREVVQAEVDAYFDLYNVDGIYFDEFSSDPETIPYYRALANHTRKQMSGALVVGNPGWTPDERVMEFVDILETFEFDYASYRTQEFPAWTKKYAPRRFLHVVHSVPDPAAARQVLNLARERNAGYVFLTDVKNPDIIYKSLGGSLWNDQIGHIKGSCA